MPAVSLLEFQNCEGSVGVVMSRGRLTFRESPGLPKCYETLIHLIVDTPSPNNLYLPASHKPGLCHLHPLPSPHLSLHFLCLPPLSSLFNHLHCQSASISKA